MSSVASIDRSGTASHAVGGLTIVASVLLHESLIFRGGIVSALTHMSIAY